MKNASDTSEMSLGTQIMIASELGSVIVMSCLLGYLGGNWLDGALKSAPYCVIAGLMLGLGVGLAIVVKRSNQLDKVKTSKAEPAATGSEIAAMPDAPGKDD